MLMKRREIFGFFSLALVPVPAVGQGASGLPKWLEIAKVLGDVAEGLDSLSNFFDDLTVQTVHRIDWFRDRNVRIAMLGISNRLATVIADQERVRIALDRFGDQWRGFGKHRSSSASQAALSRSWRRALVLIRRVAQSTEAILREVRGVDNELVLDEAYTDLQSALVRKIGILDTIASRPVPKNPAALAQLVEEEETFLRLRVAAKNALKSVNAAIKRMPK